MEVPLGGALFTQGLLSGLEVTLPPRCSFRGWLGAGFRVFTVVIPHGFDIAPTPHASTWDFIVFVLRQRIIPISLRHLKKKIPKMKHSTVMVCKKDGSLGLGWKNGKHEEL